MVHLTITALELTNHGPLRGAHRFELSGDGLAVWIRPNEFGKTTLLESVAAVLWGETTTTKNWFSSPQQPHEGALEFVRRESDELRRFRVQRDFQTHEVVAWELAADGDRRELFRGTHNPAGRTADQRRWPHHQLPKLWAAISCDAFRHLATLTQPLPDELQGNLVQQLVSGSGSSTAEDAQDELLSRFRSLSKFSKDAGLSDRNARNDGRLDEMKAQRDRLQAELSQAAGELDRAESLREQLAQFDRREQALAEGRKEAESSLKIIERHRELKKELDNAAARAKEHENALRQVQDAAHQIGAAGEKTARLSELADLKTDDIPPLKQQLDAHRLRRAGLIDPKQLAEKRTELKRQYDDVWDWPEGAGGRIRSLQESAEQDGDARREVQRLQQRLDDLRPRPDTARRRLVAAAVGLSTAMAATIAVGLAGAGWLWGLAVGFLAGVAAGATCYSLYQPQKTHPDHDRVADELDEADRRLGEIEAAIESARADVDWTPQSNVTRLVQLAERHNILRRELREREEEESSQSELRRQLDPAKLPDPLPQLLGACQGDPHEAAKKLDRLQAAGNQRQAAEGKLATALSTLGCADREVLDARCREWQDRRVGIRRDLDLMVKENALAEELQPMRGAEIETRRNALLQQVKQSREGLDTLDQQRRGVRRELDVVELGVTVNVADAEARLHQIEAEIQRLGGRVEAIRLAHRLLGEAAAGYSAHHREAIELKINDLMAAWTGATDRRFTVAEDFSLGLWTKDADARPRDAGTVGGDSVGDHGLVDGPIADRVASHSGQQEVELSALSQGARDQLALAVRMAVLDRIGAEVVLPILIDDALLTWDHQRRGRLLGALQSAAAARQFILVSHDPAFEAWGEQVTCTPDEPGR